MSKIAIVHPNAGIDWNRNAAFAVELARHLDNYHQVELLSGADCGSFSRPIRSITYHDAVNLNKHPLVERILQKWFARPEVAIEHLTSFLPCVAYLLKHPVDLVCPQNGYGGLFVATCLRAIRGTPILFTEHSNPLDESKYLQRNLGLKPDRTIVSNPEVAKYARNFAPDLCIDVIPYGINLTEFTPEGEAMKTDLAQPSVICVAPLDRNGNARVELTIEAISRLPQASLLICGNGIDRDYFQDFGDRLLGKKRFQIRNFAYAQMPQIYRSARVFTSASVHEPGLAYLEAMACGLPVVVTDDPVRRQAIGNGGIACDVTNLDSYTEALQDTLLKDWSWRSPRENVLQFGWHEISLLYDRAVCHTVNRFSLRKRVQI